MRALSLVRYWLYGLRGFVVMTVSLAIAFSVAVTGPPTDEEINRITAVFTRLAAAAGEDLEAMAIELCPELPVEARVVCAPTLTVEEEPRPVTASDAKPQPADVASTEEPPLPPAETQRSETQLLGAPAPQRARQQRAQPQRRAHVERPAVRQGQRRRVQTPARVQAANAPPAPAVREQVVVRPAVEPRPSARADVGDRAIEPARQDDEAFYQDDEEREYQDWREHRRERRRRRYEREYGAPEDYEQEEPNYRDEYYEEEESWQSDTR